MNSIVEYLLNPENVKSLVDLLKYIGLPAMVAWCWRTWLGYRERNSPERLSNDLKVLEELQEELSKNAGNAFPDDVIRMKTVLFYSRLREVHERYVRTKISLWRRAGAKVLAVLLFPFGVVFFFLAMLVVTDIFLDLQSQDIFGMSLHGWGTFAGFFVLFAVLDVGAMWLWLASDLSRDKKFKELSATNNDKDVRDLFFPEIVKQKSEERTN